MDCTANHNQVGICSRPAYSTTRNERSFVPEVRNGKTYYRLYMYDTRIIQQVNFRIVALAEGGLEKTLSDLILNVTCPSYGEVNLPVSAIDSAVTRYVGALDDDTIYTFPDFVPMEFEYCNFITSYTLTSPADTYSAYNNTIGSMVDFTTIRPPTGMTLLSTTTNARLPATRKTISVNTDYPRTYTYNIMIELKLTKTTWAEYLYSFSGNKHVISVVYGSPDPTLTYISAPASGFPSDSGSSMHLTLGIHDGTKDVYEYIFDHFTCKGANLATVDGSGRTCTKYNISSSNADIVPIVNYNGYSIAAPEQFYSAAHGKWKLKVTVPTGILRNATAGNQVEFYIWSVYNNNPSDAMADARYATFSQKMVFSVTCGKEKLSIKK
jgi:hypothetical protein